MKAFHLRVAIFLSGLIVYFLGSMFTGNYNPLTWGTSPQTAAMFSFFVVGYVFYEELET